MDAAVPRSKRAEGGVTGVLPYLGCTHTHVQHHVSDCAARLKDQLETQRDVLDREISGSQPLAVVVDGTQQQKLGPHPE